MCQGENLLWATSDLGRCKSSWALILKSCECETRSSWQDRAANDILETGLIWWTINSHSPEICLYNHCLCSSQDEKSNWKYIGLEMNWPLTWIKAIPLFTVTFLQFLCHLKPFFTLNHLPSYSPTLLPTWLSIYWLTSIGHTFGAISVSGLSKLICK